MNEGTAISLSTEIRHPLPVAPGARVRVKRADGTLGVLTYTVDRIEGTSVTISKPACPSLGGGATQSVSIALLIAV